MRTLPRALMARVLPATPDDIRVGATELTVHVADDAATLAELRVVVAQGFAGATAATAAAADIEADFFHAPGTMTYLAVRRGGQVISTASILVVDAVANVWSVATAPAARGRGAASAAVLAACNEARRLGASIAALRTTEDLARPGGLYRRLGFTHVGYEHIWELADIDRLPR